MWHLEFTLAPGLLMSTCGIESGNKGNAFSHLCQQALLEIPPVSDDDRALLTLAPSSDVCSDTLLSASLVLEGDLDSVRGIFKTKHENHIGDFDIVV